MKRYLTLLLLLLVFTAGAKQPQVRNVIFMIGDGMGITQAQLAMLSSEEPVSLEKAQYTGLCKTYSADNRVTDSAAAGTALSTGVKTYNGAIGVDTDKKPLKNLTEYAREKGLATGVVVTKDITDATPAAFLAHQPNRGMAEEIAMDIAASGADVLIGGGRKNFESRKDGVDLSAQLREKGYTVAYTLDEVRAVEKGKLAAQLAPGHMPKMSQDRGTFLPLATAQALKILQANNPKGFFLMVEGSQIDSGGHANDAEYTALESIDFCHAVQVAFDFADKNPGTLVVVTADHETGGLTLISPKDVREGKVKTDAYEPANTQGLVVAFSTGNHSATLVPVYSYGAGAGHFTGVMDNTDIPKRIRLLLGLER